VRRLHEAEFADTPDKRQPIAVPEAERVRDSLLPTLDELAGDPTTATALPREAVPVLLARCAVVQGALTARLLAPGGNGSPEPPAGDRLLTIPQVASRLGVPPAYCYELARRAVLPVVRVGPKYVRVSADGLTAWIAHQRASDVGAGHWRTPPRDRQALRQPPEAARRYARTVRPAGTVRLGRSAAGAGAAPGLGGRGAVPAAPRRGGAEPATET
jgi:excisionase family DNA binding protein